MPAPSQQKRRDGKRSKKRQTKQKKTQDSQHAIPLFWIPILCPAHGALTRVVRQRPRPGTEHLGSNANVGIATGPASGLFVLDVDPGHGGDESFKHLCQEHGELRDINSLTYTCSAKQP
ncbi:hypothetical protein CVV70_16950 [Ralstonia solanacearum]|nr:hypothetical protein CVS51_21250 [Ralstonia solanacearum]PNQ32325.1 hypothetical protein CVV71_22570 [Ralstonia solanacearum]PNQ35904.1 hypothetical protein CVT21_22910 [Ralstonia solanacearum]PNQ38077.1 hypothetical protein CVT22_20950 [Ralstonia solanacearum]PNQ48152.1 hypothetical protein CVV70_16950 [Ralstonia solanacearum]